MESQYKIRRAEVADIPRLVELLKILFSVEPDFSADDSKQCRGLELMLDDKDARRVIVAEKNEQVIGMCTAQLLISTAEGGSVALIEDVVVDKQYRGFGIGKALLMNIENWAFEQGAKRLQLLADRDNTSALGFYKSMGWNNTRLICLHKK